MINYKVSSKTHWKIILKIMKSKAAVVLSIEFNNDIIFSVLLFNEEFYELINK